MKRANGDVIKAQELQDCSYWEYYYRILQYNIWATDANSKTSKSGVPPIPNNG